jgi:hypothetical protein
LVLELADGYGTWPESDAAQVIKVFWFFFSKKNILPYFLNLIIASLALMILFASLQMSNSSSRFISTHATSSASSPGRACPPA